MYAIQLMFIYKIITEVQFRILLCKYHNMTRAADDAVKIHLVNDSMENLFLQFLYSKFHESIIYGSVLVPY